MAISAAEVKALREETGLPMMECKSALTEAKGDKEKALEILAVRYKGKMEARADRETGEGRIAVYISADGTKGGIIEFRCETAPVAKNEMFVNLANELAQAVAEQNQPEPAPEAILAGRSVSNPSKLLGDLVADVYGRLRETMNLVACRRLQAPYLTSYVHHDGKSGVLIGLDAKPTEENVGLDLCHHATFTKPLAIDRDGIPSATIEKVRKQAREIALSEGKPEKIIDKIVEGKVNAFCSEKALMEQEHVKVTKTKVRQVLQSAGVNAVTDLAFMKVGT